MCLGRALTFALLGVGLIAGCKRNADAPLPRQALFPDVSQHAAPPPEREMARAELMQATEPDDSRATARAIPHNVVIAGTLEAKAPPAGPDAGATEANPSTAGGQARDGRAKTGKVKQGKRRRKKRRRSRYIHLDDDWFRLEGSGDEPLIARVELRDAPPCARVDVFAAGPKPIRQAPRYRRIRPVIPALRLDKGPRWIRVRCTVRRTPRKGEAPERGGAYRLAVSTRPRRLDEEREPNDTLSAETQVLMHGQTVQASLAPRGDVDVFRLDLSAAEPGAAQMLSINGSPGVDLEVALLGDDAKEPVLLRRPPRGQGVLVPNLDVRRTGTSVTLRIKARRGQAPDAPYAATVRALLPTGCTDQTVCPGKVPVEREPNDTIAAAMGIKAGSLISGVLDGRGDVDWYAIDGQPGDVATVEVQAPEGLALELAVGDSPRPWLTVAGKPDGARVRLPGWRTSKRRLFVRVSGVDGVSDATALYFIRVRFAADPTFELETAAQPEPLVAAGAGRSARSGVLLPAGDVDRFRLDWQRRATTTAVALICRGDGLPGLSCALTDAGGAQVAKLAAPPDQGETRLELQLAPGVYTVTVQADTARRSMRPYQVALEDKGRVPTRGDAAGLPQPVTASLKALLGGPEAVAPSP